VSVQFSKQAAVRFPGLLGKLTAYSNEFFVKAVESAQSAFHELIDASSGNFEPQAAGAPQAARDKIVEMQAKWAAAIPEIKYDTKAARDLIPDIDWFEIGAPLGVFNNFVTEYDAESSAIAANSPKELVEMYERNIPGLTDAQRQEVLNQATYVLSRGIEEVIPAGEAVIDYTAPAAGT
jgi:homoserine kinase